MLFNIIPFFLYAIEIFVHFGPRVRNVRKWQSAVFLKNKKGTYTGKSLITFSYSFLASVIDNFEYTSKDCLDSCPE